MFEVSEKTLSSIARKNNLIKRKNKGELDMSEPLKMDRMKVKSYQITLDRTLEPITSFYLDDVIRSSILFWSEVTFSLIREYVGEVVYKTNAPEQFQSFSDLVEAFKGTKKRILYGLLCDTNCDFEIFIHVIESDSSDVGFSIEQILNKEKNRFGDQRWIRPCEIKLEYLHKHLDRLSKKGRVMDFRTLEGPWVRKKSFKDPISALFWNNTTFDPVEDILCPYYNQNRVPITSNRLRVKIKEELELLDEPEEFSGALLGKLWNKYSCCFSSEISNCVTVNDKHDRSQSSSDKDDPGGNNQSNPLSYENIIAQYL
jgi:hypothetical protein